VAVATGQAVLRITLVLVAGCVGVRFLRAGIRRLEAVFIAAGERAEVVPGATRKRITTLTGMLRTLVLVLIWAMVTVICLSQLGFDVTPIVAGAGIAGLAVGFGAQNLVRDVISGFFLVLENQVRVGDVETITFRTIVLRDLSGVVHVFPHGTVTTLANMTMEWSAYVLDVGVPYQEDTDRVVEIMRRVADEMRADSAYGSMILEPIEIFGVDDFRESAVTIKARLKTLPIEQWAVGREYRRRLKKAFDAAGVQIPFPHRSLDLVEVRRPVEILVRQAADPREAAKADDGRGRSA